MRNADNLTSRRCVLVDGQDETRAWAGSPDDKQTPWTGHNSEIQSASETS